MLAYKFKQMLAYKYKAKENKIFQDLNFKERNGNLKDGGFIWACELSYTQKEF